MPQKHWWSWGVDHLSRKPVPVFDHPLGKEMFPNVQSEPPLAQLRADPCKLPLGTKEKRSVPPSPLLRKLQWAMRLPLSCLLSKLDKLKVLSCSSQDMPSSPFSSFVALLWMHSSTFTSLLNCGAQNCRQCSRWGGTNAEYSGMIASSDGVVVLCLMHPRKGFGLWTARAPCWLLLSLMLTSTPRSLSAALLSQSVLVSGITPSQVHNLAFGLVKVFAVDDCPVLQSI